ncbi:MAG TPA: DNA-processing protein DprA, partial [Terriglobales bacterium]|nr:DNA-processing protein DprA [Terriglobales bacterium]
MSEAVALPCKSIDSPTIHWLALALTPGLGPTKARRLVDFFGSIQHLFDASLTELEAAGLHASSAQSLGTGRSMELANEEVIRAEAAGVRLISLEHQLYPAQLKQIYDPPVILYVRGNESVIGEPGIALVGTRHPTPYGSGMAERLACDLAARGLVIF